MIKENDSSEEISYEVEDILDKKIDNGKIFYKVKWLGYSLSESTWEPESNLGQAPDIVRSFEMNLLKKKKNKLPENNLKPKIKKEKKKLCKSKIQKKVQPLAVSLINDENSTELNLNKNNNNININEQNNDEKEEINEKIIGINELFLLDNELYAKTTCQNLLRDGKVLLKKVKIFSTKDLYKKAPIEFLMFYEQKIKDNPFTIKLFIEENN